MFSAGLETLFLNEFLLGKNLVAAVSPNAVCEVGVGARLASKVTRVRPKGAARGARPTEHTRRAAPQSTPIIDVPVGRLSGPA
jgi:hypothetical protein